MTGNRFGGSAAEWFVATNGANFVKPRAGLTATLWSGPPTDLDRVMYSDLRAIDDPNMPINEVPVNADGTLPEFDQPDVSVTRMWASGDGGTTGVWITTSTIHKAAATGSYTDLLDKPAIPTTPAQVGALPADTPIPATAADIGAETPAGAQAKADAAAAPKQDKAALGTDVAALDADANSAVRKQQDARHTATYAGKKTSPVLPAAVTGASKLRAERVHIGRAQAITQGSNYSAFPGLAKCKSGRLVIAYRSASGHLSTDGKIVSRYSDDQGATWTAEATAVPNAAGVDKRDPTLSVTSLGLTLTYFAWDGSKSTGIYYTTSQDEGVTWGAPVALPSVHAFWDAVTAPMIELANGDLLVPIYGRDGDAAAPGRENCMALISTNGGASWTPYTIASGVADTANYEEPFVQQLADGSLLALIRKPASGYVHRATSADNGRTWTAVAQAFTGGDGRNAFVQTSDGTLVVCPESATAPNRPVLRASYDNGVTWTAEQSVGTAAGDSGYAQLAETSPGVVALVLAQNGHSSKCSVNFRYLTVGPRVTPLGDGAGVRLPQALMAYPTGLLAWDSFDRADEANMNYSLSDSGHEWRTISGTPVLTGRTVSTNTNGNVSRLVVEAGTADVEMGMAWKWGSSVNLQALLRLTDSNNYLILQNRSATDWAIIKREAGVETDLVAVTYSTPVGLWYGLRIVCKSNRIRVFIDGDRIIDLTLSAADQTAFGTKTLFGFSTRNIEQRVKSFYLAQ